MPKISKVTGSALSLAGALMLTFSVPAFAFAEHGSSGSGGSTDSSNSSTSGEGSTTSDSSHTTVGTDRAELTADKQQVQEDKTQLADDRTAQKEANKQKVCEAHKHGLETKFGNMVANSQKVEKKIDGIYAKAQAYQTKKNLSVDSSLVSAVSTAKANVDSAISNLQSVKPSLDCNNVSVSSDVATFKTAAGQTRDALKAYRQAVKAYVLALEQAKNNATTTGGNQ